MAQIEVYSKENISICNNLLFYRIGPVIDLKMCNLREIIGFFCKNSVIFKSVCFKNDRLITQHTPNGVENCSEH